MILRLALNRRAPLPRRRLRRGQRGADPLPDVRRRGAMLRRVAALRPL